MTTTEDSSINQDATSVAAGDLSFDGSHYRLECAADKPYVRLTSAGGEELVELFVPSSVNTLGALDDTTGAGPFSRADQGEETVFTLEATSSVWRRKTYRVRCTPDSLRFETVVEGGPRPHALSDVCYFGGYYSGQPRWGSGFFWSGTRLSRGFNPEPRVFEEQYFPASSGSLIDATGVPLHGRDGWFFTPPPYVMAFEMPRRSSREGSRAAIGSARPGPAEAARSGWLGFGIEAAPGENRYTDLRYIAQRGAFHLTLAFDGRTEVLGAYRLPDVAIHFGEGPYAVLEEHVRGLRRRELVPLASAEPAPSWWRRPIFCGWGSQSHLAATAGGRAPDFASERNYRAFLTTLAYHRVSPGVLVIDDKWQATYGDNRADPVKWPDLKGFIAEQHAAGRKVLLWLKAWDPEGLPDSECVRNGAGTRVAADPTNPAYERRLRAAVRWMLGAEGYDADGFKLDFTARIPSGPGLALHGDAWGLELMRLYLSILHSEAKATKPDALMMTHTPHPYLADLVDMIRLNDINEGSDVNAAMRHRARVAGIACPDALIDTDNWPIPDRASWRAYLGLQIELGVPSLYYSSHIDTSGEPLLEEDYALIRSIWGHDAASSAPEPDAAHDTGEPGAPEERETTVVAVIHTSPLTVGPIKELIGELIPGAEVVNFVDDSVLPQLARNGGDVAEVEPRLLSYARHAQAVGADIILNACSSVGEVVAAMRASVEVPVVRIDDPMTDEAVRRGARIGVAATLPTTLAPTLALLRRKAEEAGSGAVFDARVADDAFRLLAAGDREGHDAALTAVLDELAADNDVVVLAQASMARVLPGLPADKRAKFLSSPRLGVERVARELASR